MDGFQIALKNLLRLYGAQGIGGRRSEKTVTSVAIHSRHVRPGAVFFALAGTHTDGHRYIDDAIQAGAAAVVCHQLPDGLSDEDTPIIVVPDVVQALQDLATWWRGQLDAKFVVVTGAVGKTVTKDALHYALSDYVNAHVSPGTFNSAIGVPLSVLRCSREAQWAIIEAALDIPDFARVVKGVADPFVLVITNLENQSLTSIGSVDDQVRRLHDFVNVAKPAWIMAPESTMHELKTKAPEKAWTTNLFESRSFALSATSFGVQIHAENLPYSIVPATASIEIASDIALAFDVASMLLQLQVEVDVLFKSFDGYHPTASRLEQWRAPTGQVILRDFATADPTPLRAGLRAANAIAAQAAGATGRGRGRTVMLLQSPRAGTSAESYTEIELFDVQKVLASERPDFVLVLSGEIHRQLTDKRLISNKLDGTTLVRLNDSSQVAAWVRSETGVGDVVLVHAAKGEWIEDIAGDLIAAMAPTRLYIDLDAIEFNVHNLRTLIGPQVKFMAMVKALAYGTDPVPLAIALEKIGVDYLAVSSVDEGEQLRRAGIAEEIVILLASPNDFTRLHRHRLTPVLYSTELVEACITFACGELSSGSTTISVHLEVETGMHRTGLSSGEAVEALARLDATPGIKLDGLMTHFACADDPDDDELTDTQMQRFDAIIADANNRNVQPRLIHMANSAATIRFPEAHHDMVRVGLALLGIYPASFMREMVSLQPAVRLVSKVIEVSSVMTGETVGYGARFRAKRRTRVAVVAAGYHDCVPRGSRATRYVDVLGFKAPIIGRVSMDSMMIDITDAADEVSIGTDVTIYGPNTPIDAAAEAADTIPYELMTRIGPRVQRIVTAHGRSVRPQ